jgi:riboflavin kinase/FMN adenylyltransferase
VNNARRGNALFTVEGVTQRGTQKSTKLGYPSANIPCPGSLPGGIYAGEVLWEGVAHPAAVYKEERKGMLEAHILDFSGDLYGEKLIVIAREKVRGVKKFPNDRELAAAIAQDIADVRKLCSRG